MNPKELIHKYCSGNPKLEEVLLSHSTDVAQKALSVAEKHPELLLDKNFLYEAAMLHDIGIVYVDAPAIHCRGENPYIQHGILGAQILRQEGYPKHARVAERHTGTGLTREEIEKQSLPLPLGDYVPETVEEEIICYADKFFSKTKLGKEKSYEHALRSLEKFGEAGVDVFKAWNVRFM